MKLNILSDLHLGHGGLAYPDNDADVVILAGDIARPAEAIDWALGLSRPVIYVAGNHEYYGGSMPGRLAELRRLSRGTAVRVLENDETVIAGVRFLGTTLWTDFELDVARGTDVTQAMHNARRGLNDFAGQIRERGIHPGERCLFTPQDAAREHTLSRAWLHERLNAPTAPAVAATVVVTHHGPSRRSMDARFQGSALNPCFYSDLPDSFFQSAALWVHGHTHSSSDYLHHRTRVVANPRGYVGWDGAIENLTFQKDLVITLAATTPSQHHNNRTLT